MVPTSISASQLQADAVGTSLTRPATIATVEAVCPSAIEGEVAPPPVKG
jgi:hypothetical protein